MGNCLGQKVSNLELALRIQTSHSHVVIGLTQAEAAFRVVRFSNEDVGHLYAKFNEIDVDKRWVAGRGRS